MVDEDERVSSYLKEELAQAVDKQLRVIITIILFKISKELDVLNLKQNCIRCYVALSILIISR